MVGEQGAEIMINQEVKGALNLIDSCQSLHSHLGSVLPAVLRLIRVTHPTTLFSVLPAVLPCWPLPCCWALCSPA